MEPSEVTLKGSVDSCLEQAMADGVMPGAVLVVSAGGDVVHRKAYGRAQREPTGRPMHVDTLFDLASVTKVLSTTAALMHLTDRGILTPDDPVSLHLEAYRTRSKEPIRIWHLLTHSSGLPAWHPFFEDVLRAHAQQQGPAPGTPDARRSVLEAALAMEPGRPPEEGVTYSDVGILVLTELLERLVGKRIDAYVTEFIYRPLDLDLFYAPLEGPLRAGRHEEAFATTEWNPWLNRYLIGEVHDDNTHVMGGVSGHAGLFGAAGEVHRFARHLMRVWQGVETGPLSRKVLHTYFRRHAFPDGNARALGWDVPSSHGSSSGVYFAPSSVGHLGFTGTSLWMDLEAEVIVVLLTNRIHPSRADDRIKALRPVVHDSVREALRKRGLERKSAPS